LKGYDTSFRGSLNHLQLKATLFIRLFIAISNRLSAILFLPFDFLEARNPCQTLLFAIIFNPLHCNFI